jgi:maltooligosyltrehalose trehalohydrolase
VKFGRAREDEGELFKLEPESEGYFSGLLTTARAGQLYRLQLDSGTFPDPASRFQPEGPHGPSQIVDPGKFRWTDAAWRGVPREGQVLYELHVGTFTQEGTWHSAMQQLPALAQLGVTVLEVMPVADFPGRFGWGYDGVNLYAPTRLYGGPDDFRAFVDCAHELGLGVILDVVYNHFGPDGNYLKHFSRGYFSERYKNEWGDPLNFDGPDSGPVREFFIHNAGYWVEEFHVDGLRIDATQQIFDASEQHILHDIVECVKKAAGGRPTFIVAENEPQDSKLVRPKEQGGYGFSALWNEDFHHSANVAATGRNEAYYTDYHGTPQELISAAKHGLLYQGQWYSWQQKTRGWPALDLHPTQIVTFLQNHDQVANSHRGYRVHQLASPGMLRAITALWLLGPQTPMLFQGQEFASSAPFLYFADHYPELAKMVRQGRYTFLEQFASIAADHGTCLAEPAAAETFERCKLNHGERESHADVYALHSDLLRLRREDPVFGQPRHRGVDGAILGASAFVLRFFGEDAGDRLLLVNLGVDLLLHIQPEPLLAPLLGTNWKPIWSSENPRYGGSGTPLLGEGTWRIPGAAALVLASKNQADKRNYGKTHPPDQST